MIDYNSQKLNDDKDEADGTSCLASSCPSIPDGTHPSDYTKVGSKVDMRKKPYMGE